jgi:acyl-homoserine lactone acylase PvdQ
MRFIADLGAWDNSLMNVTTGQSAQALSGHYTDQWSRYYQGLSYPMQFNKVDADDTLEMVPQP